MSDREPGFENAPFPEAGEPALAGPSPSAAPPPASPTAPPPVPAPPAASFSAPPYSPQPPAPPPGAYSAPPYAPPPYPLPQPGPRVGYAGFWIRFVAWFLDAIILWVVNVGAHAIIRVSAGAPVRPWWSESSGATMGLTCAELAVGFVLRWLYLALSESSAAQATIGKRAMRLRVTDLEGRRISFARATGRAFAKIVSAIILGIGFLMIAFTGRRQGLHDMMAETVVLRDYN